MRRVAAIVQARMGSARFPGKVLAPLAGRPMLAHIIDRLRECRNVGRICIATSRSEADAALMRFAEGAGVFGFAGDEEDVLRRYIDAGHSLGADVVVRVTGDAPLIHPQLIDDLIDALIVQRVDYAIGDPEKSVHEGFEVATLRALERCAVEGTKQRHREHVTAYIRENPGLFRVARVPVEPRFVRHGFRLSVDTASDLAMMDAVYRELWRPGGIVDLGRAIDFLDAHPEVFSINQMVRQKDLDARSARVGIRVDAGPEVGMGHLVRCRQLAKILCEERHAGIWFFTASDPTLFDNVRSDGHRVISLPAGDREADHAERLAEAIRDNRIERLVIDLKRGFADEAACRVVDAGALVTSLDDISTGRERYQRLIYPVAHADPALVNGARTGAEYVIIREEILKASRAPRRARGRAPSIFAFFGAGDEAGVSLPALRALARLPVETTLVLSRSYSHFEELSELLGSGIASVETLVEPEDFGIRLAGSDLALLAFGQVVYEAAFLGVPFLTISHNERNESDAARFAGLGAGGHIGPISGIDEAAIIEAVQMTLSEAERLAAWSEAGRRLVDGRGAWRVVDAIMEEA